MEACKLSSERISHLRLCLILVHLLFFPPFFLNSAIAQSGNFPQKTLRHESDSLKLARIREVWFSASDSVRQIFGNASVSEGDTVNYGILHFGGDLTVAGVVFGNVISVNGGIDLAGTSLILGDVICINGQIERDGNAGVRGEMIETIVPALKTLGKTGGARPTAMPKNTPLTVRKRGLPFANETFERPRKHVMFRYNRVEGVFLGARISPDYEKPLRKFNFSTHGFSGYGFKSKDWRYRSALEIWPGGQNKYILGAALFDLTETEDGWRIAHGENTLAASLLHEDYMDYFRAKGFQIYQILRPSPALEFRAAYVKKRYSNMAQKTDWSFFSIFRPAKSFSPNPEIDEGTARLLRFSLNYDTRDNTFAPFYGWFINGVVEWNPRRQNSDLDHQRFVFDLRRFLPLSPGENLDFRIRVASSRGNLPRQHIFHLGGFSSLRGFGYKAFSGNRLVLFNIEYRLNAGHQRLHALWLPRFLDLIFFLDAGGVWRAAPEQAVYQGFAQLSSKTFHSNLGIAITEGLGRVRLNFARGFGSGSFRVTFRLNRAF